MKKSSFRKPKEKPKEKRDESYQGTFSGDEEFDELVEQKSPSQINAVKNPTQGIDTTGAIAGGCVSSVSGVANVLGGNNRVNPDGGPSHLLAGRTSDKSAFTTARVLHEKENVQPDAVAGVDGSAEVSFEPETYLEEYVAQFSQRLEMETSCQKDDATKVEDVAGDKVVTVKEEVTEAIVSEEAAQLLFHGHDSLESIPPQPIKKTQELLSYASVDFDRCPQSSQEKVGKKLPQVSGPSPAKRRNILKPPNEKIETIRSVHYGRGVNKQEMLYKKFFKGDFGRVRNVTEPPYDWLLPDQPSTSKAATAVTGSTKSPNSNSGKSNSVPANTLPAKSRNSNARAPNVSANSQKKKLGQNDKPTVRHDTTQAAPCPKAASNVGNSKPSELPSMSTPMSIYDAFFSMNREIPVPPDLPEPPRNDGSDDNGEEEVDEVLSGDYAHLEDPGEGIEEQLLAEGGHDVEAVDGNDGNVVRGQCAEGQEVNVCSDGEQVEDNQVGANVGVLEVVEDEERAPELLGGVLEGDGQAAPGVFPSKQKETLGRSKIFPNLVERTVKTVERFIEKLLWTMKIPENLKSPEKERYEVMEQFRGEGFDGIFKSDNFGNAFHVFCLYLLCARKEDGNAYYASTMSTHKANFHVWLHDNNPEMLHYFMDSDRKAEIRACLRQVKKNEEDRLRFAPKKKRGPRRISDKDLYKITVLLPRVMFEQARMNKTEIDWNLLLHVNFFNMAYCNADRSNEKIGSTCLEDLTWDDEQGIKYVFRDPVFQRSKTNHDKVKNSFGLLVDFSGLHEYGPYKLTKMVKDGVGGKELFWRKPIEMTGRRKIMKKENLRFLPGPFYKSKEWGDRHGSRLMGNLKEYCVKYGIQIQDYTTAVIRKEEVQILTFADHHFYTYMERYRPELMVFARTPRDIEDEVRQEHPHLFIPPHPSSSSSGSHPVSSQIQSQPEIPQPSPPRSQVLPDMNSDSEDAPSDELSLSPIRVGDKKQEAKRYITKINMYLLKKDVRESDAAKFIKERHEYLVSKKPSPEIALKMCLDHEARKQRKRSNKFLLDDLGYQD